MQGRVHDRGVKYLLNRTLDRSIDLYRYSKWPTFLTHPRLLTSRSSNGHTLLSYIVLLRTLINEIPENLIFPHNRSRLLPYFIVGDRPPRFLILRRRYCQDWCNRITEVVAHALEIYIDASCLRFRDPKGLFGYLNLWGGEDECLTGIPDIFVIVFVWLIEEKWVYFHVRTIMEWFGFDWNPVFWITRWDYEFRWLGYCFRTRFFFL